MDSGLGMLKDLLWFIAGGWIGSIVTLVMVALLRRSHEAPKPDAEEIDLPKATIKPPSHRE